MARRVFFSFDYRHVWQVNQIRIITRIIAALALVALMPAVKVHAIEIIADIKVGKNPRRAIIAPGGSEVYVSNRGDNTVSIINTRRNKVIRHIEVGLEPEALVISSDGRRVFVGNNGKDGRQGSVSVIDTSAKKVVATISTDGPVRDLAIKPDGRKIYLAMEWYGLGKIEITTDDRYDYTIINPTPCPESVVFTPDGEQAYVNYQCAPDPVSGRPNSPDYWGHDPIFVFDAKKDQRVAVISHFPDGTRMANVGGFMAISPDGAQIWANGSDACSRKKTVQDPDGYDFEGCPALSTGESFLGRGIINIIDVKKSGLIQSFPFRGYEVGKKIPLGALVPTFFPDGKQVAVGTGSRILLFDPGSLNQIGTGIAIPMAGNLAFSPDGSKAYVPVTGENSMVVKVWQIKAEGPSSLIELLIKWYLSLWEFKLPATILHILVILILWFLLAILNARFVRIFSALPILRIPVVLDIYFRKQRSKIVSLYLAQLNNDIRDRLKKSEIKWVALPLKLTELPGNVTKITTEEWLNRFVKKVESQGHLRVAMAGPGGTGKTVLIYELVMRLIKEGHTPTLLEAASYEGGPFHKWLERILKEKQIPINSSLWGNIPHIVYLIDQASEVPLTSQKDFWQMVQGHFSPGVADVKILVAGRFTGEPIRRFIGDPRTGIGQDLAWEEIIQPDELQDEDIRRLGSAYLDPSGESEEIQNLPNTIRNIMPKPTAFVVTHYVKARRESVRSIKDVPELFQEILDAHVKRGEFATRPDIVKLVLESLVKRNYLATLDRGLSIQKDALVGQVNEIIDDLQLKKKYGEEYIPNAGDFVDRLLPSGLVYPTRTRYLFFHDLFEDWLAGTDVRTDNRGHPAYGSHRFEPLA